MENGDDNTSKINTELHDILTQVAELDKWRQIFNARGLELPCCFLKLFVMWLTLTMRQLILQTDKMRSERDVDSAQATHQRFCVISADRFAGTMCESEVACEGQVHVAPAVLDFKQLLQTIRSLQPSRLSYIELLQEDVRRSRDRPPDKVKAEEEVEDVSRSSTSIQAPQGHTNQLLVPYSVPRTLAISPSLGGKPVMPELAMSLRKILFGTTFHVFNYEWKKSFFKFREPCSGLSYALEAERGGARAIQMAVQAHVLKILLFTRSEISESCRMESLGQLGVKEQEQALALALAGILWTAGEKHSATVALVTSERCFTPHLDYKLDSFTERLQLFTFRTEEDTQRFIYEHIQCFNEDGSHGVILFLYSLVFSRSIVRLQEDLDPSTTHLLQLCLNNFVCRQALMNLLLMGRASPNVFNGTLVCNENGSPLAHPLHGVLARSDVGYLHWSREQADYAKLPMVGSMLKTPKLPIWVCSINGTYSVLFSPNRSLLSDWKMEHLFHLYFYNGQLSQGSTTMLTIDTHSHHWEAESGDSQGDPERRFPSLEMIIRTKWDGAVIDWNGTVPFF